MNEQEIREKIAKELEAADRCMCDEFAKVANIIFICNMCKYAKFIRTGSF